MLNYNQINTLFTRTDEVIIFGSIDNLKQFMKHDDVIVHNSPYYLSNFGIREYKVEFLDYPIYDIFNIDCAYPFILNSFYRSYRIRFPIPPKKKLQLVRKICKI